MRKIFTFYFFLTLCSLISAKEPIKVACVGDSVTYGYGIADRDNDSYPAQLQRMLGEGYDVRNFGHNGATLLRKGHRPYNTLPEYGEALDFKADLVIIHLGLNDTDPRNWPNYSEEFIPDYKALINDFRNANPDAKIWICKMTPIMHGHARFLSGTRDWHFQEQKAIAQIAATSDVALIDLFNPLITRPELFADNLHPSPEGAGIIAKTVYEAITGDFGGLQLSAMYTDNMVVQRDKPIRFSGKADRGSKVKVRFAGNKQNVEVGADGKWVVEFPAMPAGGPYKLEISDKDKDFAFSNVWVGEVWVCAGQSNMEFQLFRCTTAQEDIASAGDQDKIHLFHMKENWLTNHFEWPESALDSVNHHQYFTPMGWKMSSSDIARDFSAVGYHFGRALADSLGCHVGLINCSVGGSTTESWVDRKVLAWEYPQVLYNWMDGDFGQPWARDRCRKNIELAKNPLQRHPYQPGYLYDAGILQMDGWNVKGVIFYQGESNAHCMETFADLFKLMVKSFRNYWGEDLAIQMVQLSGIGNRPSWPWFRDVQRQLSESITGVGLTVCSDLGHPTDVHPKDKKPVGERSAVCALHDFYGREDVIPSGPVYKSFVIEGSKLRLSFDYAEGLNVSKGFEIAGADGIYYPASVKVEGETIVLEAKEVKNPCAVRYAWQPNPTEADLTNISGIPASTFRDEKY